MVPPSDQELQALARTVEQAALATGAGLATAESCTGGWVAKVLTDLPGCSRWFDRGFVTYSNAAKQAQLEVPAGLLERDGAVSRETVRAMAVGALARSEARVAVAISGIAGPGGGSAEKPVGTVWLAWARRGVGEVDTACRHFPGDRDAVRRQAVATALEGLATVLSRR
ncbi:CinA family protein [Ectothiorhodospira mobilis]|uniref:CinA family protein n=1 Tax=Ectothiorhodospira mobilis TaxID=195064 RepID=UPI001905D637|nr:nicotinamide-nucleotide amidohydrolase family protein [Ectothiorhodospira mobilis]MBK1690900.1 damage-inducible protein CinA [Ectothiorhodospira mobilis]